MYFTSGTKNLTSGVLRIADRYIVRVASTYRNSGGKLHYVKKVFAHPKFVGRSDNFHHDVGLLQLKTDIRMDNSATYITIAHAQDETKVGTDGVVSGWGKDQSMYIKISLLIKKYNFRQKSRSSR